MGVHHGVDIYKVNGPKGFDEGHPVIAIASGLVVKSTIVYGEMTDDDFQNLLNQSEALGQTPPEILDRLEGKQVVIDHGNGLRSVYAHLQAVAPGIVPGAHVEAGQVIGGVGITGTQAEGKPGTEAPHLHFEIWVGDRYLGFGLTLRETMWWFHQIFDTSIAAGS
jgi:murein DD-endopeptidase MepM/ murein hydrolase activator NlpD